MSVFELAQRVYETLKIAWLVNIRRFDQYYQPGEITSQVSVLIIGYLVAVSYEL